MTTKEMVKEALIKEICEHKFIEFGDVRVNARNTAAVKVSLNRTGTEKLLGEGKVKIGVVSAKYTRELM